MADDRADNGADNSGLKIAGLFSASFTTFAIIVLVLMFRRVVTFQMAMLMLVALVGLHFGFGVLIFLYRLTGRLK
jgi:hypothetical protein